MFDGCLSEWNEKWKNSPRHVEHCVPQSRDRSSNLIQTNAIKCLQNSYAKWRANYGAICMRVEIRPGQYSPSGDHAPTWPQVYGHRFAKQDISNLGKVKSKQPFYTSNALLYFFAQFFTRNLFGEKTYENLRIWETTKIPSQNYLLYKGQIELMPYQLNKYSPSGCYLTNTPHQGFLTLFWKCWKEIQSGFLLTLFLLLKMQKKPWYLEIFLNIIQAAFFFVRLLNIN